MTKTDDTQTFEQFRPDLLRLAYRMTGGQADAEDIVQDAWLRWHRTRTDDVRNARAWLSRTVARLAIDHLRKVKTRRETYVGPWLPEPVVTDVPVAHPPLPGDALEIAQDVSMALMMILETLKPEERAAFLLRAAFELPYAELATELGKSEDACRQMVSRARTRLRQNRPRFEATDQQHEDLLLAFAGAAQAGDTAALTNLMTPHAKLTSDGGGKVSAALRVIEGAANVASLVAHIAGTANTLPGDIMPMRINGRPGFIVASKNAIDASYSIDVENGRIAAIYVMRNPDKLAHLLARSKPAE